jgi:hypothetical protein
MTISQQLHQSATHCKGNDPACPACNPTQAVRSRETKMTNGYVVYPTGRSAMTLKVARKIAKEDSLRHGNDYQARIEQRDTEKTIARYQAGIAVSR